MSIYLDFDIRLCIKLREGSKEAFLEAFDRYNRLLYAYAYRFLKSEEEAEDAVQHAFMKLWESHKKLVPEVGVRSLLCTIVKNYALNELRHHNLVYEKNYQLAQEACEIDDSFLRAYEDKDLHEQLMAAIRRLPIQKSVICMMKLKKGFSNQEIAEHMHLAVATVKVHYTQAIKMLRKELVTACIFFTAFL